MTALIILGLALWFISAILRSMRMQRIEQNQEVLAQHVLAHDKALRKQGAKQKTFEERWSAAQDKAEKEHERVVKQQEQMMKRIAKVEAETRKNTHRIEVCTYEIEQLDKRLDTLEELREMANYELERACHSGDDRAKERAMRKLIALDNQISAAETKRSNAQFNMKEAQFKLKEVA